MVVRTNLSTKLRCLQLLICNGLFFIGTSLTVFEMEAGKKRKALRKMKRQNYAVDVFVRTWALLKEFYTNRAEFVLRWILGNEELLNVFLLEVGFSEVDKFSKRLLFNGYYEIRKNAHVYDTEEWDRIDGVFLQQQFSSSLPRPIQDMLGRLLQPNLQALIMERQISRLTETNLSLKVIGVSRVKSQLVETCRGCFLGVSDEDVRLPSTSIRSTRDFIFRSIPSQFYILQESSNCTYLFDRSGDHPMLIATRITQKILKENTLLFLRRSLENLFVSHPILMRCAGKRAFDSAMKGYGPFYNQYKSGTDRVSFYTHTKTVKDIFKGWETSSQFQNLVDRFSHMEFVDILISMYLWWCPRVLTSFFEFSDPHLHNDQYDVNPLERALRLGGPSAYQLYISKDYCAEMHSDEDVTDFTLCYCSHPDDSETPIDFVIAEYGIRVPLGDGDLFAFRSSVLHGTAYRKATANAAYVGAITVNKKFHQLLARRKQHQLSV